MIDQLIQRPATKTDLYRIIELLFEDELGASREHVGEKISESYYQAFDRISNDPNQFLMVCLFKNQIVATCHLTIMPSLTFQGATRMQIEAVRVSASLRGQKIGNWMMQQAMEYGKSKGASIFQLTTNKKRSKAKAFYESLGFEASHEGMKLVSK